MSTIPTPGPHGGDAAAIAHALGLDPSSMLDLSQTLNPVAPDTSTLVAGAAEAVGHDPDDRTATALLAETLAVDPARLLLTNGGSEAIAVVAAEVGGGVAAEPEFSLHPRGEGVRWRSDPHNPSGRSATPDDHADVWDEAFYPLATGHWHAKRPGVAVGSLTKVFACPGLRLGYVIADEADRFRRHQPAWSVNSIALAVLPDLLASADIERWAAQIADLRAALVVELTRRGLRVDAADAPWVLVEEAELRSALAPHGIVVRDCGSFGLPTWVRIAVPDTAGLVRLSAALDAAGYRP